MNKSYLVIGTCLLFLSLQAGAQNLADALRYSSTRIEGTARSGGMGNAFGALGGDFTSVGINPAALGIYRSGELALSPYFGVNQVESRYLQSLLSDNKYKMAFSNLSYVATLKSGAKSETGLVSVNIGVGYNRLADFSSNILVEGHNAHSSFLDHIAENANLGGSWSEYYEELASKVDLLQYDTQLKEYWHDIEEDGYGQSQRKSYSRKGAMDEYTLGVGLNFSHKVYVGASLGIVDLYFKESTELTEWDANNNILYFNDFRFNSSLRTAGTGFNAKIGVIFKPINEVRLGASIHTPTFFSMNDNFETSMQSSITYDDGKTETHSAYSPYSDYDYDLETPFRATFSGAVILAKKGLLSVDYELVNYSAAKFRNGGDGYAYVNENKDIKEVYKSTGNIRLGGEYRLTDAFSARAGYEYYPSAYKSGAFNSNQPNADMNFNVYSLGFGYKTNGFFFDVAYRHTATGEFNLLYPAPQTNDYPTAEMAKFDTNVDKVIFTLGFRF